MSGADGAANATNGALLNNQLAAEEIANGHAFGKHVIDQNEFGGTITTQQQFADQIENILNNPSATKQLSNGRSVLGRFFRYGCHPEPEGNRRWNCIQADEWEGVFQ